MATKKTEAAAEVTTETATASAPPPPPVPVEVVFPPKQGMPTLIHWASEEDALRAADLPRKTAEAWAELKGMLPEVIVVPTPPGHRPVAPRYNPEFWRFAGARALSKWPFGAEIIEAEFDAAVAVATTGVLR